MQAIDGFYLDIIFKILPYVCVSDIANKHSRKLKNILHQGNSKLILKYQQLLEKQKGYLAISDSLLNPNSGYLGGPQKLYCRYNFKYYDDISFGITAKKDAGEEFFNSSQKNGFDFYSAHLFFRNLGNIKSLAIGDYQASFGQGLTFSSGLAFYGKSSEIFNIRKFPQSLKPYTSSDEYNFLRGTAATIELNNFELTAFYSQKQLDATIVDYDSLKQKSNSVSSIDLSGLHNTASQLSNKNNLQEKILGGHISFRNNRINIGATAYYLKYDKDLIFVSKPYNQFDFKGNNNLSAGLDYNYSIYNFNFFGEVSRSQNNSTAFLNGILLCPFF